MTDRISPWRATAAGLCAMLMLLSVATALGPAHPPAAASMADPLPARAATFDRGSPGARAFGSPESIDLGAWSNPAGLAYDNTTGQILVTTGSGGTGNGSVAIIDPTTENVSGWISGFSQPTGIAYDGLNANLYVADFTPCCPAYLAVAAAARGASVSRLPLGTFNPGGVTFDPDNGNLYVSEVDGATVTVVNGSSDSILTNLSGPSFGYGNPGASVYDPANHLLYVPVAFENDITLIDTVTESIVGSINLSTSAPPAGVALDPTADALFVAEQSPCGNCSGGSLVELSTATNATVAEWSLPNVPTGIAVDPTTGYVFVPGESASVSGAPRGESGALDIVDPAGGGLLGELPIGNSTGKVLYDPANENLYLADPAAGSVVVVPGNLSVYPVTLTPSGLPGGTPWTAELAGGGIVTSSGGALTVLAPNGTYAGTAVSSGGRYLASFGPYTVAGAPLTVPLNFTPNPNVVTFVERGLPVGTYWSVLLRSNASSNESNESAYFHIENSTSNNISFVAGPGEYSYVVFGQAPNGTYYRPAPSNGTVSLSGTPVDVYVRFAPLATVVFEEDGLPSGVTYAVVFNGTPLRGPSGTDLISVQPPGTYAYSVPQIPGYIATPHAGAVTLTNATVIVPIDFTVATFPVQFSESGLPAGTSWSVSVDNQSVSSAGASIAVDLPNGSFAFEVRSPSGYLVTTPLGNVTVTGSPVAIELAFQPELFAVGFSESGLPTGTPWSVTLGASTVGSATASLSFALGDGTYPYSVSAGSQYTAAPSSGSVTVAGDGASTSIVFRAVPEYSVTFSERGLSAALSWSVALAESSLESSSTTLGFLLPNGTYTFAVTSEPGYLVATATGTIVVSGKPVAIQVNFTAATPVKPAATFLGMPASDGYLLTGLIAGAVAGLLVGILLRGRRPPPRPTADPPGPPPPG